MSKPIIGVMGPGNGATQKEINDAYELGKLIAEQNWVLLTGGRNAGVMNAASKGAKEANGLTVGILSSENKNGMSEFVDIPICTGMGSARNNINVLSSDVVIACGAGAGTTSEVMLALKAQKPLILLAPSQKLTDYISELNYPLSSQAQTVDEVIQITKTII
jgi:uncharacterized protein (TIGR00725 family)